MLANTYRQKEGEIVTGNDNEEYMTLNEAATLVGIKRASLYHYIEKMELETYHFEHNKHAYLTRGDVERIKQTREKPWKVSGEVKRGRRKKRDAA